MWVYVEIGGRILASSNEVMDGTTGWHDLPGFPGPEFDARGIAQYAYVPDGSPAWRERTQEEMDADYVPPEPVTPLEDRVGAVEIKTGDLEEALDMILSGVTE